MSESKRYVGPNQRTFPDAVRHLLETQYGVLGSERVLNLLASDIQHLAEQFYPQPDYLAAGWMIFTGTRASGKKAHPGQRGGDHELVTLAWPVLTPDDLEEIATCAKLKDRQKWWRKRIIRILEYGYQQAEGSVLLTLADLACMLGLSATQVSHFLQEARAETGKTLLTKGYFFDQGSHPTHKAEIIELYESGLDEAAITQRTHHAQDSVGQYIRDYERVKKLVKRQIPVEQIPTLLDMQGSLVKAYLALIHQYHPELTAPAGPGTER